LRTMAFARSISIIGLLFSRGLAMSHWLKEDAELSSKATAPNYESALSAFF
jgi:hypothetical protein